MSFDLARYLDRIALPAPPAADAAGLQALHRAHRLAIPFENLDVRLGRAIALDSAAVFAKLVEAKRGGYCFEQDRLFADALAAIGFVARPLLARVWLGQASTPPLTHTLSLVTVAGQPWIADAGFGGSYAPPMPLAVGATADAPDGARFRLLEAEGGWMLERLGDPAFTDGRGAGPGWQRQYGFTLDPTTPDMLAAANRWTSGDPASRFVNHAIVNQALPRGFASLTDRRYRRRNGEAGAEGTLDDPRVYRLRLALLFGIQLSADEVAALGLF